MKNLTTRQHTMSKILTGLLFIALFFVGWHFGSNTKTAYIEEKPKPVQLGEPDLSDLEAEVARLRKELQAINAPDMNTKVKTTTESQTEPERSENQSTDGIKEANDARIKRLTEKLETIEGYEHHVETNRAFENEERNDAWANPRIEMLRNIFSTVPELQDKNIKSIECRSKHCRIELYYEQEGDINNVGGTLTQEIMRDDARSFFISSVETIYSRDQKTASFFLSDDVAASLY